METAIPWSTVKSFSQITRQTHETNSLNQRTLNHQRKYQILSIFVKTQTNGTSSDNGWHRVTISANFSFFKKNKKEPTTKHPKENSLNIENDLWRRPIELGKKQAFKKKY